MLTALIMAGGKGERFWPLSTEKRPKQLLKLFSNKSMIRETVDRIFPIIDPENIFIATNEMQVAEIKKELPEINEENIIIEPMFKDTAAAVGYAVEIIDQKFKNTNILVLAADHIIKKEDAFRKYVLYAQGIAEKGNIVTFGINPDSAKTEYGYIKVENIEIGKECRALSFVEKPNSEKAKFYFNSKKYLWNSGMFVFKSNIILKEIEKYLPLHHEILQNIKNKFLNQNIIQNELSKFVKPSFEKFEKISLDMGVMEKSDKIKVIPVDIEWNDVGNFNTLSEIFDKNENNNVVINSKIKSIDSKNNIVITNEKEIVLLGINDLIIVESDGKILISKKDDIGKIKRVL